MHTDPTPELLCCFPPVINEHVTTLILGSLPGAASLKATQYYAHPQNKFWELVGAAIDVNLRALPYATRLETLLAHGIGLWDVIAQAEREGSLDAAIRNETHNALLELVESLPALKVIAFNGGTAAKIGRKQLKGIADRFVLLDLPSSSPAYTLSFELKKLRWQHLADNLID
jgi:hypoxanthine-DNA glycosylase